jgi:hopanoid biosynthesis associated RND transporter like protein HpnN
VRFNGLADHYTCKSRKEQVMLRSKIAAIVTICARHAWAVVVLAAILTVLTGFYTARNFSINTDVNKLISPDLPWRQRELAVDTAFPHRHETILAVVEAPTSELATQATTALVDRLAGQTALFRSVRETEGGPFFTQNALLFLPKDQVASYTGEFARSQALIQVLVSDQNWRGLVQALTFALAGIQRNLYTLDQMSRPLSMFASTLEDAIAGRPASFSWRELVARKAPEPHDLRRIVEIIPVLDYAALEPGEIPTKAIRQAVNDLKLVSEYRARVRLTGPVPIQDEEFGTLKENAELNAIVSLTCLIVILWLALRSWRIIASALISIFVGLVITAALGLAMVGTFNPISIAFAVLFVGIGVDFGIQFGVRYRAERYEINNLRAALSNAARYAGVPLTLAATATACGFMSFLPTPYKGVSELGQIAGVGMIVALIISITLLPALLKLMNPPGESAPLGYSSLAGMDKFMERHRIAIIVGTAVISLGGLPLLYFLQFDFNPMNLRSPKVESMATYIDLRNDPTTGTNGINVLAASLADARTVAERLAKVPEAERAMTLDTFIPSEQEEKLALIKQSAATLDPAFKATPRPPPTDAEAVAALKRGAETLIRQAGEATGPGADAAKRLAAALTTIADGSQELRERSAFALISPLKTSLEGLRASLQAHLITEENLPPEIKDDWLLPDGRALVTVHPKGDPNDNETLRQFARAVLVVEPSANGGPISILESGNTVVRAFIEAGIWAFLSIAILLWIVLRRFTDVMLTLIPLLLAGVVTLELCVLLGLKLNFANIIALPVLLGIGVAFKIYYIMAWRAGQTGLLQSPLTRAVIFSALTTATAFGSLWLSSHPGTSSMGKLLALSLVCTLAAAVLFQPVLMGPPREVGD